jgi:type II secretory pathway pseudopilin PulG
MVEVVIVLAIVVITSGVGIVRYSSSLRRYRVELAAQRLAADLALVQTRARTSGQARSIMVGDRANAYLLVGEPAPDGGNDGYRVELNVEPYLVTITHVDLDIRGRTLTFDGYGAPNSGLRVELTSGDQRRLVVVEPVNGRIRIDAP